MSRIGALTTGAGIESIFNLSYVPEFILVGTTDTDLPLTRVSVSVAGEDFQNINGQSLAQADSKINMEGILGADVKVGQLYQVADGLLPGQTCQIRLTNAGATAPDIYAFSTSKGTKVLSKGTVTVKNNDHEMFSNFQALVFDPSNLDYAQVTWADGTNEKMSGPELNAVFSFLNTSDADGDLAGLLVLNNSLGIFLNVDVYADGGDIAVLVRR